MSSTFQRNSETRAILYMLFSNHMTQIVQEVPVLTNAVVGVMFWPDVKKMVCLDVKKENNTSRH